MEQELRNIIYELVREVEPGLTKQLTTDSYLRFHFETGNKKITIAKDEGFISVLAFESQDQQWIKKWEFDFLPISNHWTLMGMHHLHTDLMDVIDEEEELHLLVQFCVQFQKEFYMQLA